MEVVPSPKVMSLTAYSMHGESVILSCAVWTLLSTQEVNRPLASMLEGEETPENTERDVDGTEPAAEGDIQMD